MSSATEGHEGVVRTIIGVQDFLEHDASSSSLCPARAPEACRLCSKAGHGMVRQIGRTGNWARGPGISVQISRLNHAVEGEIDLSDAAEEPNG